MRNKRGLTISERINKDIELARMTEDTEERKMLAYMAIASAEFAVDFDLITRQEWDNLTQKAFSVL